MNKLKEILISYATAFNPTEEQKIRDKEVREEIGICVHNTCLTMKAFFDVLYTKEEREAYKKYMDEMYLNDE